MRLLSSLAFTLAVLFAALAAFSWWNSADSFRFRARLTALAGGYDGCLCSDCAARYGLGPAPFYGCCPRVGPSPHALAAPVAFIACVAGLVFRVAPPARPPFSREVDPYRCACGYDLHGLAADRCPECGGHVGLLPDDPAAGSGFS